MTKVCHMTSVHAAEDVRIFKKECVSLAEAGYETYLVEQGDSYEKNGVHIIGVGAQEKGRLARMFKMSKRVYKEALKIDADIYHFHDPELLPYGLKLKKKGKKVIFDSHENTAQLILEKNYIPFFLRSIVSKLYKHYENRACRQFDGVIYVSPNLRNEFESKNNNVVCLANYPLLSDKKNPKFEKKNIFFGGLIIPEWHHEDILKAIEGIDDITYTLCGTISEEYLKKLKTYKAWEKVRFLGHISHSQVYDELNKSYIGLAIAEPAPNTNWNEGTLGVTKLFEEMMAGIPVICSDFTLWKDIVEKNKCGFCVTPGNDNELRETIQKLLRETELAKEMGMNGRRIVEEEYNWSVESRKLLKLYRGLV